MIPNPNLSEAMVQNFLFVLFNITMAVYYIEMLEKWPKIGRFAQAGVEIKKLIEKEDVPEKKNLKIIGLSWSALGLILLFSLLVMGWYLASIRSSITSWDSFFFYLLCVFCFFLIPKFGAGFISGITVYSCSRYFHDTLVKAYRDGTTKDEVYLTKEYIDELNLRESPERCKRYGKWKSIGNFLYLLAFLLVPCIGRWNCCLFVPFFLFLIAFFLPLIENLI